MSINVRRSPARVGFFKIAVLTVASLSSGCALIDRDAHMEAFSTQMTGLNEVPAVGTYGVGRVDAVLNRETRLFRWKISFSNLSGPATAGHFHGPAPVGDNAGIVLPFKGPVASPLEGQATLSEAQVADLLAGKWYANIHTAANPKGEIRGQLILRK